MLAMIRAMQMTVINATMLIVTPPPTGMAAEAVAGGLGRHRVTEDQVSG